MHKEKNRPRPQGFGAPGGKNDKKPQNDKTPEVIKDPGTSELTILAARVGDTGLVATNPELCCATELAIKKASPFKQTMVISFTDGPKGIMADKDSFEKECAEGKSSFAQKGSAEQFAEVALNVLKVLK